MKSLLKYTTPFLFIASTLQLSAQNSEVPQALGSRSRTSDAPPVVSTAGKTPAVATKQEQPSEIRSVELASAPLTASVLSYSEHDVLRLKAKLRHTTLIILPKNEQILDFTCGDKEFWIVNGNQNFAYVKPARANSETNLNLVTASGNVYSFLLTEVSGTPTLEPDLKVFIELRDPAAAAAIVAPPRFVAASEIDNFRQQVAMAKDETRQVREQQSRALEQDTSRFRSEYPMNLKFTYYFERSRAPFQVSAIYHDDRFTYIQARPQETPALYELKDGKPNLINFQYRNGTYVVEKILESGYLAIGKAKLYFARQE